MNFKMRGHPRHWTFTEYSIENGQKKKGSALDIGQIKNDVLTRPVDPVAITLRRVTGRAVRYPRKRNSNANKTNRHHLFPLSH